MWWFVVAIAVVAVWSVVWALLRAGAEEDRLMEEYWCEEHHRQPEPAEQEGWRDERA